MSRAAADLAKQGSETRRRWISWSITIEAPTIIFCDNKAAVQLADSDCSSKRMKHIATKIYFLREQIADKAITMLHIVAAGQLADIFTKPLAPGVFHAIRVFLLG